jgi:hypothetical protein
MILLLILLILLILLHLYLQRRDTIVSRVIEFTNLDNNKNLLKKQGTPLVDLQVYMQLFVILLVLCILEVLFILEIDW